MIPDRRTVGLLLARAVRFGFVGLFATATDFGVFNLGIALATDPGQRAIIGLNTLAFAVATAVSYSLNSRYTFAAPLSTSAARRYLVVALCGAVVYDLALLVSQQFLPAGDLLLLNAAKLGSAALSASWNFVGFSVFVFGAAHARVRAGGVS